MSIYDSQKITCTIKYTRTATQVTGWIAVDRNHDIETKPFKTKRQAVDQFIEILKKKAKFRSPYLAEIQVTPFH